MKKKLLIATSNPSKFKETVSVLKADFEVLNLKDFPNIKPVAETGKTFEENAILKAKGYFEQIKIPCIADDGGLVIDYLHGAPGVNSHRFLGYSATEQELAEAIIKKMAGVPYEKRTARLGGVIIFWDGKNILKEENWINGYVAEKIMGKVRPGFPYRPVLIIPELNKTYSELTPEEHERFNFRRKNLKMLKEQIAKLIYQ